MLKEQLKLTALEWSILKHRLQVPDAIAEALDSPEDEVEAICKLLRHEGLQAALNRDRGLTKEVLIDCVEGSTYYGCFQSLKNDAEMRVIGRAGDSLSVKIAQALGLGRDRPHFLWY